MYQARNRIFLHIVRRHRKVRLQGIALPLYLYPVESRIQYLMGQDMFHPLQISRNIQPARSCKQPTKSIRRLQLCKIHRLVRFDKRKLVESFPNVFPFPARQPGFPLYIMYK